ncbi:MAG: type II-B CRISPR-associated RNA-guided endonuclease Cas9/Csx12 [Leptospira sp.]|nr:type II-B CRISPR-associated RNA-guided endonuclease Cas9/Csx12 [Leptospira sp.]
MKELHFVSPISIDLGAKTTGLVTGTYQSGEILNKAQLKFFGKTVEIGEITFAQGPRTVKRHQMRGFKRRKLAKRLFFTILNDKFQIHYSQLPRPELEAVLGLFNRRGFTYFQEEVNWEILNNADLSFFRQIYGSIVGLKDSLGAQLVNLSKNASDLKLWIDHPLTKLSKKEFEQKIKLEYQVDKENEISKETIKTLIDTNSEIQNYLAKFLSSEKEGHFHRKEYFENILYDLNNNTQLVNFSNRLNLKSVQLKNLIGHISNLQLRVLRKYFNDKNMTGLGTWNAERFYKYFFKWIIGLRPTSGSTEQTNRAYILKTLKSKKDIMKFLTEEDPICTIPPYEDQNNRRPPICHSLLFNTNELSQKYPSWELLVNEIVTKSNERFPEHDLKDQIDEMVVETSHKSAFLLQRFYDRSESIDPYAIRKQIKNPNSRASLEGWQNLESDFGTTKSKIILEIGKSYHAESNQAKKGLWYPTGTSILRVCKDHPRLKKNQRETLLGGILGIRISKLKLNEFEQRMLLPVSEDRKRSLKSVIQGFEELRKEFGNSFKYEWEETIRKYDREGEKALSEDHEKKILRLHLLIPIVSRVISQFFDISNSIRFQNPFSLAQIYNIMFDTSQGFFSTCEKCTSENHWRSSNSMVVGKNDILSSNASRLPADSVRPFDGQLAKLIQSIAYQIAYQKIGEIKNNTHIESNSIVHIPIVIEENQFQFTESLMEIKGLKNKKKLEYLKKRSESEVHSLKSKQDRIKSASKNICPYTGKTIKDGEIDHILPRSFSTDSAGTILNSEPNLIYVSREGNRKKGDRIYTLENLDSGYLKIIFGTSDIDEITKKIIQVVDLHFPKFGRSRNFYFQELTLLEQDCIRHSLFLEKCRTQVADAIYKTSKSKVNGTQSFLAKEIQRILNEKLKEYTLKFSLFPVKSKDISESRQKISETLHHVKKTPIQGNISHIIDATLAMHLVIWDKKNESVFQTTWDDPNENETDEEIFVRTFSEILPNEFEFIKVDRRPKYNKTGQNIKNTSIFKDTIYAEHFVPLLKKEDKYFFGFNINNSIEILKDGEKILLKLNPFLKTVEANNKRNFEIFYIDKGKAMKFLHEISKSQPNDDERELAIILNGMKYFTKKQEIWNTIFDKGKIVSREEILKDKNFDIEVKIPKSICDKENKKIRIPSINEWKRLLNLPELNEFYSQGDGKETSFLYKNKIELDFFKSIKFNVNKKHTPKRKVFSLPMVDSPSGGFRIKRKNFDGSDIFQTVSIEGLYNVGFYLNENNELSESKMIPALEESPNLSLAQVNFVQKFEKNVKMDEWREIDLSTYESLPIVEYNLSPGSQDRMFVRLKMKTSDFAKIIIPMSDCEWNLYQLPSLLKLDKKKNSFFQKIEIPIQFPRDGKIRIQSISESFVLFSYTVESTTKDIEKLYNLGKALNEARNN